jgi:hypothetical protein
LKGLSVATRITGTLRPDLTNERPTHPRYDLPLAVQSTTALQRRQALIPYLHDLGITDIYASPLLQAKRGSMHGYDVADPSHLNSDLGTAEEFDALIRELQEHRMGLLARSEVQRPAPLPVIKPLRFQEIPVLACPGDVRSASSHPAAAAKKLMPVDCCDPSENSGATTGR